MFENVALTLDTFAIWPNHAKKKTQAAILNEKLGLWKGNVRLHGWKKEREGHSGSMMRVGLHQGNFRTCRRSD